MTDTTMRIKKEWWCQEEKEEEAEDKTTAAAKLTATTNANNVVIELKRVQTELRITKILKNELEMKLDKMKDKLLEAETKVYTTSQKKTKNPKLYRLAG